MALLLSLFLGTGLAGCGRSQARGSQGGLLPNGDGEKSLTLGAFAVGAPSGDAGASTAGFDTLWSRAKAGQEDDLIRLAQFEGPMGLLEAVDAGAPRLLVARALAYAEGNWAMPWLADVAARGRDDEAQASLESLAAMAARPRPSVDAEDALEVRAGCDALMTLAKDSRQKNSRRVGAIRVVRMLADRGCASPSDIPTDFDRP